MGDAYGNGGGYPNYSQPPPYSAYQNSGYGYGQEYYGQENQSAYDQGQSTDSGWGQQSGGRGTSRGSYRGAYRGRGYGGGTGGYGSGDGNGSSGSGIDRGYGGDQRGGFGKGGDGSFIQPNTIFVSQMDPSVTEDDIAAHFGSIGVIKVDKHGNKKRVWLYRDKITGISKGEATVTYDDPNAAQSAISWFNGKEFRGSVIKVQFATTKDNWSGGGQGGRGGGQGGRGGFGDRGRRSGGFGDAGRDRPKVGDGGGRDRETRDGDWKCLNSECGNTNFAWRTSCNRCGDPKSSAVDDGDDDKHGDARRGRYGSSPRGGRGFRGGDRGFGRGRGGDGGRGFGGGRGGGGRGRDDGGRGGGRDRGGRGAGRPRPTYAKF